MSEKNMSLLSQDEIDALITFLMDKKDSDSISGDILSQSSINKLIELVKAIPSLNKNVLLNTAAIKADASSFFANKNNGKGYELSFKLDDKEQLIICACNVETEDIITITPLMISSSEMPNLPDTWGVCMSPNTFHCIAKILDLHYSDETFKAVSTLFAKKMYGSADVSIPAFYLP